MKCEWLLPFLLRKHGRALAFVPQATLQSNSDSEAPVRLLEKCQGVRNKLSSLWELKGLQQLRYYLYVAKNYLTNGSQLSVFSCIGVTDLLKDYQ